MYRLEHGAADKEKLKKAIPSLFELQEAQDAWKDDFALNSLLRTKFRVSCPCVLSLAISHSVMIIPKDHFQFTAIPPGFNRGTFLWAKKLKLTFMFYALLDPFHTGAA